jgi:hypothetical protein
MHTDNKGLLHRTRVARDSSSALAPISLRQRVTINGSQVKFAKKTTGKNTAKSISVHQCGSVVVKTSIPRRSPRALRLIPLSFTMWTIPQKSTLNNRQSVVQTAIGCSAMGHNQTSAFHLTAEHAERAELGLFQVQERESTTDSH